MMHHLLLITLLLASGAGAANPIVLVESDTTVNYLIHFPFGYEVSSNKFPLLIFLHGIGERGNGSADDMERVKRYGPFKHIEAGEWDDGLPFVVVGPQAPGGLNFAWSAKTLHNVLNHVLDRYRIDVDRIYVTGFSMGGKGSWDFVRRLGDRVAAIVPTAAWSGPFRDACENMSHLGVWAFHGERDRTIGRRAGTKAVDNFNKCHPKPQFPAELTVIPRARHEIGDIVYLNQHRDSRIGGDGRQYDDIYRWLLSFSLTDER